MTCPEAQDILIECRTGTAPPATRRALETHLRSCDVCRARAAELQETVGVLRAVPDPRLPEGHWPAFMEALDRRLQHDTSGWRRVLRWIRHPRRAWSAAAVTSALMVALGVVLLVRPVPLERAPSEMPGLQLEPFLTESVVQAMPSVTAALDLWKAGFTAADVAYDLPTGGP